MNGIQIINVAGKSALVELDRLRSNYAVTGLYPILFGDSDDYERITEGMEESAEIASVLEQSQAIDAVRWFSEKLADDPEHASLSSSEEWEEAIGEDMGIIAHLDILSHKPKEEVRIGLIRVASPWEVFAHLNWGGWNDCPFAAEHCAIHRHWATRYGAEVVSITGDTVQCVVSRPPRDRDAARGLAQEQYAYCYDIVEQGVGTIPALAAGLLNSKNWYFWWD